MIHHGDCIEVMKTMASASVDSIVTDPPYHLTTGKNGKTGFMGKAWDGGGVAFDPTMWQEALRVLKPGGYLLAMGGTRTYHRMVCAIEDAGFEIRDTTAWLYGSGFPKSLDVSKAIDKEAGAERKIIGTAPKRFPASQATGWGHPGVDKFRDARRGTVETDITIPATEAAKQWDGWGTALKPAMELIVLARKPLAKGLTVAANVLEYGTGALNIGACRVEGVPRTTHTEGNKRTSDSTTCVGAWGLKASDDIRQAPAGRWPANVILSDDEEVRAGFPMTGPSPKTYIRNVASCSTGNSGLDRIGEHAGKESLNYGDSGSAARFFYTAKASKADRGEGNIHPTTKPVSLMRYLCCLITPPGGTILDPFAGSGSTGKGAVIEGFNFIGIERELEYVEIARKRIAHERDKIERAAAERLFA